MFPLNALGIPFAISAAIAWGSADFCGGFASRRKNPFQVMVLSSIAGIFLITILWILKNEPSPTLYDVGIATLAGIFGAIGLSALYYGLASGKAASVAPIAGVIGVALPVLFSAITDGLPGSLRVSGFVVAMLGIWLVTRGTSKEDEATRRSLLFGFLAGANFGMFFIFNAQLKAGPFLGAMMVLRLVTLAYALLLSWRFRLPIVNPTSIPIALLAGLLDATGNMLYVYSARLTRLDMAAVLSSLYPAATVVLTMLIVKEKISFYQWIGGFLCLAAVVLITV